MAKGKKKLSSKNGRVPQKGGSQCGSSDDESVDTCSVFSGDSQCPARSDNTTDEETRNSGPEAEVDTFEDKLKMALDGASGEKSSQKRSVHLQSLCKAFGERYCLEFLLSRPTTMTDLVEKSLKKGKGDEQAWAATLASILVLQYGASAEGAEVYHTLSKLLTTTMQDNSVPPQVREKVTMALAMTAYMAEEDTYNKREIMDQLRSIFGGSFLKGDGTTPSVTAPMSALHQAALLSWALMLTAIPADIAFQMIQQHLADISGLLECQDVDMRVAAGEALATMYEMARDRDEDFEGDDLETLCDSLHQLATDSQKFRAKKDRKLQKSSFRDIERAVREGEGPVFNVQFGVETLKIRTWEDKRTYDALCCVLNSGMNHHLQNNPEVRALFGLGAPLVVNGGGLGGLNNGTKVTKFERHMGNLMADRNRTKRMAKVRDKRLDIM